MSSVTSGSDLSLERKVAIVIGAAAMGSIGHACAVEIARLGFDVALFDIDRPGDAISSKERDAQWQGLPSVVAEVEALDRRGSATKGDVTKPSDIERLVATAESMGRIVGLVNTSRAPLEPRCSVIELPVTEVTRALEVNLLGALMSSSAVAGSMIARGTAGSIVHISSVAGFHPLRGRAAYSISKAALNMLTRSMAMELAPAGIRVNGIAPGIIATDRVDPDERARAEELGISLVEHREQHLKTQEALVPLGRVGEPTEIARVAGFLLSEASSFVTGETVAVSGGVRALAS
jgi:NAD(P)-dependent dehydrogenase (short-subunit alcohol dehydrogenase family)